MTLRVVPGYRRMNRRSIGMVSVFYRKGSERERNSFEVTGMVPERERMISESVGMVSRVPEYTGMVPGNIGMVPGRFGNVPGLIYIMFINYMN
jgi:hypothetical protein